MKLLEYFYKFIRADKFKLCCVFVARSGKIEFPYLLKLVAKKRFKNTKKKFEKKGVSLLFLNTPDGLHQCVHPDIVRVAEAYYMAITPYPFGMDIYENPVIYKSDDCKSWRRLTNRLDNPQGGKRNHLSDPTLIHWDGKLYCFYRECIYSSNPNVVNIYRQESLDGISWGNKIKVFSSNMESMDIISPDVCEHNNRLMTWACLKEKSKIELVCANDIDFRIEHFKKIRINNLPNGKMLWHISAVPQSDESTILLLTLSDNTKGVNSELYIAIHYYNNDYIDIVKKVPIKNNLENVELEYRATGYFENNTLNIIASIMYDSGTWGCIHIKEDDLENTIRK